MKRARIALTAQEAIVEELRSQILSGTLAPGTPLRQAEIAAMHGVSTTPVREGLRQLAAEGLVDGDPHRSMWVHTPTAAELDEVYRIIEPLERMAMEAAARAMTPEQLAEAERLLEEMEADVDTATWVVLNLRFHGWLLHATGMPVLEQTLRRLRNLSSLYVAGALARSEALISRARHEHRALVDAIRSRDAALAGRIAVEHLAATREARLAYLGRAEDPGATRGSAVRPA